MSDDSFYPSLNSQISSEICIKRCSLQNREKTALYCNFTVTKIPVVSYHDIHDMYLIYLPALQFWCNLFLYCHTSCVVNISSGCLSGVAEVEVISPTRAIPPSTYLTTFC